MLLRCQVVSGSLRSQERPDGQLCSRLEPRAQGILLGDTAEGLRQERQTDLLLYRRDGDKDIKKTAPLHHLNSIVTINLS